MIPHFLRLYLADQLPDESKVLLHYLLVALLFFLVVISQSKYFVRRSKSNTSNVICPIFISVSSSRY